jgi:hypothetical protein
MEDIWTPKNGPVQLAKTEQESLLNFAQAGKFDWLSDYVGILRRDSPTSRVRLVGIHWRVGVRVILGGVPHSNKAAIANRA